MQIVALYGTRSAAASGKSLVEMVVGSLTYARDLLHVVQENTLVSYPILDPYPYILTLKNKIKTVKL